MAVRLLQVYTEENCPYCGQDFLIVAVGEDEYGNEKKHAKCRYCGASAFDKIGVNEFVHLEGLILERIIEYLQHVSPLKYQKKGEK